MNYTAEDLQMDLFAPSRPMLCPALEKWQESYDKALDRKWKRQLCSSWKIAEKNSNGVYAEHWHAAINSRNGLMLELSMALRGDDVVAELDLESRIDNSYGRYSPLSDY